MCGLNDEEKKEGGGEEKVFEEEVEQTSFGGGEEEEETKATAPHVDVTEFLLRWTYFDSFNTQLRRCFLLLPFHHPFGKQNT